MSRTPAPETFVPLSPQAFQILLSLLERRLHGYSIVKDVEERTGGDMILGTSTAYAAIKRMLGDGLLEEAEPPAGEPSGGPRRKYYRITELGRKVARAEGLRIASLQEMVEATSLLAPRSEPRPGEAKS